MPEAKKSVKEKKKILVKAETHKVFRSCHSDPQQQNKSLSKFKCRDVPRLMAELKWGNHHLKTKQAYPFLGPIKLAIIKPDNDTPHMHTSLSIPAGGKTAGTLSI